MGSRKWILGLCKNIEEINNGQYYLDTDSECPDDSANEWKDFETNKLVQGAGIIEPNLRVAFGVRSQKNRGYGALIFKTYGRKIRQRRVRKCLEWRRIPILNKWTCKKFFPSKKIDVAIRSQEIEEADDNIVNLIFILASSKETGKNTETYVSDALVNEIF